MRRALLLSCVLSYTLAVLTKNFMALGDNSNGQLGGSSSFLVAVPFLNTTFTNDAITQVATGPSHTLILTASGLLYAMGNPSFGRMGVGAYNSTLYTTPILTNTTVIGNRTIAKIAAGYNISTILTTDGKLYSAGTHNQLMPYGQNDVFGEGSRNTSGSFGTQSILNFAIGSNFIGAIGSDMNSVYTFGTNEFFQLAVNVVRGTIRNYLSLIYDSTGYASLSLGDAHAIGITQASGNVQAWGKGALGRLGYNAVLTDQYAPITPTDDAGVRVGKDPLAVAAGFDFSVLLNTDGTVFVTGSNAAGQLCQNTTGAPFYQEFTQIIVNGTDLAGKMITQISAGYDFVLILTSDGYVYACGGNSKGQLGLNSTANAYVPTQVLNTFVYKVTGLVTSSLSQSAFLETGTVPTAAPTLAPTPTPTPTSTTTTPAPTTTTPAPTTTTLAPTTTPAPTTTTSAPTTTQAPTTASPTTSAPATTQTPTIPSSTTTAPTTTTAAPGTTSGPTTVAPGTTTPSPTTNTTTTAPSTTASPTATTTSPTATTTPTTPKPTASAASALTGSAFIVCICVFFL